MYGNAINLLAHYHGKEGKARRRARGDAIGVKSDRQMSASKQREKGNGSK